MLDKLLGVGCMRGEKRLATVDPLVHRGWREGLRPHVQLCLIDIG